MGDKATGKEQSIRIEASSGLSDAEVEKMVNDAKKHEGEDKAKRELIDSQNQAEQLIYQTEENIEEHKEKIQKDDMKNLNSTLENLKKNKDSSNLESLKSSLDNLNKSWSEVA